SIKYLDSWHNSSQLETKNISIELINFNLQRSIGSNWSSCVNGFGATPGQDNSIDVKNVVSKAKLEITPNPFSPDNDGFEDFSFINYNLTKPISQVRIRIFDSKGRKVRSIANNELVGSTGTIIFDGLDENNHQLKMGIYIVLFEAVNIENVVVDVIKEVVVVARKL
ncbi:MAG: gliding motility-associated C-terminal domain-containing protein, partial [Melioribacteraceae bacterium]|nr:gliding motility-associated C-terminal domain-containing protein [Melioribacteraceae bacterium]